MVKRDELGTDPEEGPRVPNSLSLLTLTRLDLASMSLIAPTQSKGPKRSGKGGGRRAELNKIYAHPLPVIFTQPEPTSLHGRLNAALGLLGFSGRPKVENPHCEGIFDPITRSVWVTNMDHCMILWQRGFFGKGDLSRSEPSWMARQINLRKSAGKRTFMHAYLVHCLATDPRHRPQS